MEIPQGTNGIGHRLIGAVAALGMVAVTLAVVGAMHVRHGEAQDARRATDDPQRLAVPVQVLEEAPGFTREVRLTGRVLASREVGLAFEPPGRVKEVLADRGDAVQAGDVLARLDTRRLESRLAELEARIEEARASLALARRQEEREAQLAQGNLTSRNALDQARTNRLTQQARLAALESERVSLAADLEDSTLTAPFAGRILERHIDPGSLVGEGAAAFRLIDSERLEAHLGMPALLSDGLAPGERVRLERNGHELTGTLRASLPEVNSQSRTRTLVVGLDPGAAAVPGDLVTLRHRTEVASPGYWVPLGALLAGERGLWSLLVAEPEEGDDGYRVRRASVELLHSEGDRAFVRGTLTPGMRVISAGTHRVFPGQRVSLNGTAP